MTRPNIFVGLAILAGCSSDLQAKVVPTEKDLEAAQIAQHRKETGAPSDAFVACNGFIGLEVTSITRDGVAELTYDEYRSDTPEIATKPMKATLKLNSKKWDWVKGDSPRCAYATIDIDLGEASPK
jgi:hypothetical protein